MRHDETPFPETDLLIFYGDASRNWKSLAALGAGGILLGLLGLVMTVTLTLASVVIFGVFLVVGGLALGVHSTRTRGWSGSLLNGLIALLYVVAGASAIANPVGASAFLTLLLAAVILAVGVLRLAMAWQMRGQRNLTWPLIGGFVAVALALMIFVQWPSSGLWVIGLFISIELIAHGISILGVALAARDANGPPGESGDTSTLGEPHTSGG